MVRMIDKGNFDKDRWQLFHTDEDRSEAHDLADAVSGEGQGARRLWLAEAKKYNVLPLNDYGIVGIHALEYKVAPPANGRYIYYPGTTEVPEASAAQHARRLVQDPRRGRVHRRLAGRDLRAGLALRRLHDVREGRSSSTSSTTSSASRPSSASPATRPRSGKHIVGVEFKKESVSENIECSAR